jgi:hypothetical protein
MSRAPGLIGPGPDGSARERKEHAMAINSGKVVAGGLLAGLLFNAGDFLINGVLMADDYAASMSRLGLDPAAMATPTVAMSWIVVDFLFGLIAVWTYAAIRPRFGAGPKTAVLAAVPMFAGATLVMYGFTSMGVFTFDVLWKGTLFSVVNVAIGSIAGAWVYSER